MTLTRPILLVLAAMAAFGLMALFTREANAPVLTVAVWRAILVAGVFAGWAAAREGGLAALRPDRKTLRWGVPYGVALAVASSTFVGGYTMTTVANTIFLHNLAPLAAFPLAWWMFQEKPRAGTVAGAGVALLGVALLSGVSLFHFSHFTNPRFLLGDLLALTSALAYASVLVLTRAVRQERTPLLGTLFVAWTTAAILLTILAALLGTLAISPSALLWVLGLAVVCTNIPFYLLNKGMREVGAGTASLLSMTEVVFATAIGVMLYHEDLAPIGWMGGAVVGLGVLYPFLSQGEEVAAGAAMPLAGPGATARRWGRLGIGLALFNLGAVLSLLRGMGAGAVLAWVGAAMLLRLGPPALLVMLEGRFPRALRWTSGIGAVAVVLGLVSSGSGTGGGGLLAAGVALLALLADRALAQREDAADRDPATSLHAALALLALAQFASLAHHPAAFWLPPAAAAFAIAGLWSPISGAIRGGSGWWHADRRPDAIAGWLAHPGRAGVGVVLVWLVGGVSAVPAGHQAIIERFGAPLPDIASPGLLLRLPPPIEQPIVVDVASVRRLALQPETLLCGDQSMVSLSAALHYTVVDAHRYTFAAANPDETLRQQARAALAAVIGRLPQDAVLTDQRKQVEDAVLALTTQRASEMGLAPVALHLTVVAVPAPVMDAFLDVISAAEERSTLINQAEAYAASVVPQALGQAAAIHHQAAGDALLTASTAESWASRLDALSVGGAAAPALSRHRIQQEGLVDSLTGRRLVLAPASVHLWLGGTPPSVPVEKQGE